MLQYDDGAAAAATNVSLLAVIMSRDCLLRYMRDTKSNIQFFAFAPLLLSSSFLKTHTHTALLFACVSIKTNDQKKNWKTQ